MKNKESLHISKAKYGPYLPSTPSDSQEKWVYGKTHIKLRIKSLSIEDMGINLPSRILGCHTLSNETLL